MGQVLQPLVPPGELSGISCTCDVKLAYTSKPLRFFCRLKAIIGGIFKNCVQMFQALQSNLVVSGGSSQKFHAWMICHHQWNVTARRRNLQSDAL